MLVYFPSNCALIASCEGLRIIIADILLNKKLFSMFLTEAQKVGESQAVLSKMAISRVPSKWKWIQAANPQSPIVELILSAISPSWSWV